MYIMLQGAVPGGLAQVEWVWGLLPIDLIALLALGWLVLGLIGLAQLRNFPLITAGLYPLGALIGVGLTLIAGLALAGGLHQTMELAVGLPGLPLHLRLDPLSAFFIALLGGAVAGVSIYASGYIRVGEGTAPGLQCMQYHAFLASMVFVLLADDTYAFMLAWESMAMSSFFLVAANHREGEIRRAAYLYLLMAHVGAVAILFCFALMHSQESGLAAFTFDAMRHTQHAAPVAAAVFFLALAGFGAKAGLLPLHVWLPEAHPAAPSPVSAVMSGVMLKTAIYGILRVTFDLLHTQVWWWGMATLILGLVTALFGVIFAAVQVDMKRLLAWSSIENLGILFVGVGLSILFAAFGKPLLAALAMTATLYHAINHAFFKSLLFLTTGSVLHATHERNLGKLGGLIRPMPWVAWLALLGVLASAGLPPLNGFVSEWLLLQGFLFTPGLPQGYVNMLVPVAAAAVALTAALSGYVMVKFYGVIFLGQQREEKLDHAEDAGPRERLGLIWLGLGCVLLGVLPTGVISLLSRVTEPLVGAGLAASVQKHGWFMLAPIAAERASYNPLLFLVMIVGTGLLIFYAVGRWRGHHIRRAPPWDCGFPLQTGRMQDTAEGFSQPLLNVFDPFYRITREVPSPFDAKPHYRLKVEDKLWYWLYLPVAGLVDRISHLVARLHTGRIAVYLTYSFATLLALLLLISR